MLLSRPQTPAINQQHAVPALSQGEVATVKCWTAAFLGAEQHPRFTAQVLLSGGVAASLDVPGSSGGAQLEGAFNNMLDASTAALACLVTEAKLALREAESSGMPQSRRAQLQRDIQALASAHEEACATNWSDELFEHTQPASARLAAALQAHWQEQDAAPERQQAAQLELAQAAAARASCAHLACPNLEATGRRGKLCTGCRVARYCCRDCSVADWRAGHHAACRLLAGARDA